MSRCIRVGHTVILLGGDRSPFGNRINCFGHEVASVDFGDEVPIARRALIGFSSVPLIVGGDQINYAVVAAIAIFGHKPHRNLFFCCFNNRINK